MLRDSLLGLAALFMLPACTAAEAAPDSTGEELFGYCVACHGPDGSGNAEGGTPAIGGMQEWYVVNQLTKFKAGIRGNHHKDLEGMRMRPMARTLVDEAAIAKVATYVSSLPPVKTAKTIEGGDATSGEAKFMICQTCHGADAGGMEALGAPSLHQSNDWYYAKQIHKFQNGVRGYDAARDPQGVGMAGMSRTLTDDQAIKDVFAYIETLEK